VTVQPPDRPGIRISDADRERAARRLHEAMAEGRITLSELEDRLTAVYGARYEADLRPPLADLPAEATGAPVPTTPAGPALVLKAGMSTIKRTGSWAVPARLRVQSGMGSVVLDFCDAENPHPVVDDLVPGMGSVKSKVPSRPRPGSPHFVVHGRTTMGSVTIRTRYRIGGYSF